MTYKVKHANSFHEDYDNLFYFIIYILRLKNHARKINIEIDKVSKMLSSSPEMFAKIGIKDRYGRDYRRMVIEKKYILLYTIDYDEKIVYILHLYNGRQNYLNGLI